MKAHKWNGEKHGDECLILIGGEWVHCNWREADFSEDAESRYTQHEGYYTPAGEFAEGTHWAELPEVEE